MVWGHFDKKTVCAGIAIPIMILQRDSHTCVMVPLYWQAPWSLQNCTQDTTAVNDIIAKHDITLKPNFQVKLITMENRK